MVTRRAIGILYLLQLIVTINDSANRGDPVLSKRFHWFDSGLVLGPIGVKEQQKRSMGFDPLLSDSFTL